jgi:hypothetical protein
MPRVSYYESSALLRGCHDRFKPRVRGSSLGWRGWFLRRERCNAALSFLDLFASHALLKSLPDISRVPNPAGGRQTKPFVGFNRVGRDTFAFLVTHAKIVLREGVAVFSGLTIPFDSLGKVQLHSVSGQVELRETVLSPSVSLFGGTTIPFGGFGRVARRALAHLAQFSQSGLRGGIPLVSRLAIPLGRLSVVLLHSLAIGVTLPQLHLGFRIPSFCLWFDRGYINGFDSGSGRNARFA